jgi:S-adenosylmethionine/arginine decarboxylase-like enzyme
VPNTITEVKQEATGEIIGYAGIVLSALIRALYIFVLEAIIHGLLHALERHVSNHNYPVYVYRTIDIVGVGSFLVYVFSQLWIHFVKTYVETRIKTRKLLEELKDQPGG